MERPEGPLLGRLREVCLNQHRMLILKPMTDPVEATRVTLPHDPLARAPLADPALLRLVAAAERGEPCPAMCFIVGGWLMQGTPVSTQMFYTVMLEATVQDVSDSPQARRLRGTPDEEKRIVEGVAHERLRALGHPEGAEGPVLSLVDVRAHPPGAPALEMDAVRVTVMSIVSWWATPLTSRPRRGGGGGGAVGIGVGVGLGDGYSF